METKDGFRVDRATFQYELPETAPSLGQLQMTVQFDANAPFPKRATGTVWGDVTLTQFTVGKQAPIEPVKSNAPASPRGGQQWEGALPPEQKPSLMAFALRDAYALMLAKNEDAAAFASEFPQHRLCSATYATLRPLVPLNRDTWRIQLCDDGGQAFQAMVRRDTAPNGSVVTEEVYESRRDPLAAVVPRSLMPASTVPLDALRSDVLARHGWSPDQNNLSFVVSADNYEKRTEEFSDSPAGLEGVVNEKFLIGGSEWTFRMADGRLSLLNQADPIL